jgi:hypothetical protein
VPVALSAVNPVYREILDIFVLWMRTNLMSAVKRESEPQLITLHINIPAYPDIFRWSTVNTSVPIFRYSDPQILILKIRYPPQTPAIANFASDKISHFQYYFLPFSHLK